MGSKTGDENFGHALHDDLTLSAICKKIKQKESEGSRRVRMSRRAWKYRIDDDENEKESCLQRCSYISRRTQLACKNYRPASELTSEGFCEVHTRFFKQLAHHASAEQRRIERTLLNRSEEPLSVNEEDETLMTVTDWSYSQQELFNDLLLDDDDEDPLKNAGVWTDEEVLRCELVALERRLSSIRDFRKLIAEKARRLARSYAKKMSREQKQGKVGAENKRSLEIQIANRKYHMSLSPKEQYMIRRLKARLEWDGSEEHKFDYLKVDDLVSSRCAHFTAKDSSIQSPDQLHGYNKSEVPAKRETNREINEKNVEENPDVAVYNILNTLCDEVALALSCGKDPSKECKEFDVKNGCQCCKSTIPEMDYCIKHIWDDRRQRLFAPCMECGSLGLNFDDGQNCCFKHIGKRKHSSSDTREQWKIMTVQQGVVPSSTTTGTGIVHTAEQIQSAAKSGNLQSPAIPSLGTAVGKAGDGKDEPPIKFVIIDEEGDEGAGVGTKINTPTTGTIRHPGDIHQHGVPFRLLLDDPHSSARTRPFTPENFHKIKMRHGSGARYSVPDVKDYLGSSLLKPSLYRSQEQLSKTMVHDLLSGGPSKAAASASQLSFAGNRRISAPATSFTPLIGIKRTIYGTATNKPTVEAPETITLGSASTTTAPSSASSTSAPSRSIIQRPILVRNCANISSNFPRQSSQLPSIGTPRYVATVGISRSLQNFHNRSTISLDSRIRRTPINAISPMDYSNRPLNPSSSVDPFFRRRDDRQQFVTGNARSRLVAIDPLPYAAPRGFSLPSYPPSSYRKEISRTVFRSRVPPPKPKAPPTADTLETAAAVASIAADLEKPADKELDEADDDAIGTPETHSWGKRVIEQPLTGRTLVSEQQTVGKIRKSEAQSGPAGMNSKLSAASLSRQSSGENPEDGLSVLAMAAASRAASSDHDQPSPSKKFKYGQLGLEEEDDE